MDDVYGPPLPPGFKLASVSDDEIESEPPLKKTKVFGPQCPAFLEKSYSDESLDSCGTKESDATRIVGPVLPTSFKMGNESDDDNEVYGPMPCQTKVDYDIVNIIEKRANNMKDKLDMKDNPSVERSEREEWMMVPDTSRRNQLGVISRCLAPGSKISREETDSYRNPEEDEKTSKVLKKYNKSKRGESLLDMHRKKKKDKKDKNKSKEERKAFDRDEIAVRHFTKKQVNSVIDKAKYLNSRFAPGKSSQYL